MTFLVQINQGLEVHLFVSLQLRIVQQNVKLESLYAAQEKTLFEWWIVERQFSSVTALVLQNGTTTCILLCNALL